MIKGKPPRLVRVFAHQPLYFVTFCTLFKRPVLGNDRIHKRFRQYCLCAEEHNVAVGRYVIMPDHIHLFVRGGLEFNLGVWVRGLKRSLASGKGFWQPGFFDHVLRHDESYAQKWIYVRENPVRAGMAHHAENWPHAGEITEIDRV